MKKIITVVVCLIVLVGAVIFFRSFFNIPVNKKDSQQIQVVIPAKSGVSKIGEILKKTGLIRNKTGFIFKAYITGSQAKLKAGNYYFSKSESGKEILTKCFFTNLTKGNLYQFQTMVGHPWWASHTSEVVSFTRAQTSFNTLKLESIIEDACNPQNKDRFFIAELIKISAGELEEYFSETAFQLQHNELMRLPGSHFSEPIPFPRNLSIIGTIDTIKFNMGNRELLSQATIIDCDPIKSGSDLPSENFSSATISEKFLLRSSIRDPQQAFRKLSKILKGFPSGLLPFFQAKQVLQKFCPGQPRDSILEGIIYLANSWSATGEGLFDRDSRINLHYALDLAISQSLILPFREQIAKSDTLQKRLYKFINSEFPQTWTFLSQIYPA